MSDARGCDSHFHVFGGPEFPFAAETVYVLEPSQRGLVNGLLATFDSHGISHGLAVAAQGYLYDNRAMLDAIARSKGRLKGVALVKPSITDRELDALGEGGVVGIRMNPSTWGMREFTEEGADRLIARVKERGWFLQVHVQEDELVEPAPIIRKWGIKLVIDHFGRPDPRKGLDQPGFKELIAFGKSGNAIVKLSGPYRTSLEGPPYRDTDRYVEAAVKAFTIDNCVWGSDWPFTRVNERIDYGPQLDPLKRWLPDAGDRRKVLWENPSRFFGFK
jgi:predicted TIM-barrel fold metal-dependent hydrolase